MATAGMLIAQGALICGCLISCGEPDYKSIAFDKLKKAVTAADEKVAFENIAYQVLSHEYTDYLLSFLNSDGEAIVIDSELAIRKVHSVEIIWSGRTYRHKLIDPSNCLILNVPE